MKGYKETDKLGDFLISLKGKRFTLDCGHKVTFGTNLGNNIIIYNGKKFRIICTLCGY